MVPDTPTFPTRHAQAERNRDNILAAARAAFAEPNAEISMAEISRRAGVGMATLYRNFPGRRELLEALYIDEVNAVCEAVETVDGDTPGERFDTWLHRFFAFFNSKHHVAELLQRSNEDTGSFLHTNRDRVLAVARPLLLAAQRSHEIRDDLTLEQILEMIIAIATIHSDPSFVEPILQTALDGLRVQPRAPSTTAGGRH
jgi:AcrR family transcriptional regulator